MSEKIRSRWCPTGKRCLDGPLSKDEGYICGHCQYWHRHEPTVRSV